LVDDELGAHLPLEVVGEAVAEHERADLGDVGVGAARRDHRGLLLVGDDAAGAGAARRDLAEDRHDLVAVDQLEDLVRRLLWGRPLFVLVERLERFALAPAGLVALVEGEAVAFFVLRPEGGVPAGEAGVDAALPLGGGLAGAAAGPLGLRLGPAVVAAADRP